MSAEAVLDLIAEREGWNTDTKLALALEYIENQMDDASWECFLAQHSQEANASPPV